MGAPATDFRAGTFGIRSLVAGRCRFRQVDKVRTMSHLPPYLAHARAHRSPCPLVRSLHLL